MAVTLQASQEDTNVRACEQENMRTWRSTQSHRQSQTRSPYNNTASTKTTEYKSLGSTVVAKHGFAMEVPPTCPSAINDRPPNEVDNKKSTKGRRCVGTPSPGSPTHLRMDIRGARANHCTLGAILPYEHRSARANHCTLGVAPPVVGQSPCIRRFLHAAT